jgi:hypothetical protein
MTVSVTASVDVAPGAYALPFSLVDGASGDSALGQLHYSLAPNRPCYVRPALELFVVNPSVVDDPVRTARAETRADRGVGSWTFGRLMERVAPSPEGAPAFVLSFFEEWVSEHTINTFVVPARPAMRALVLDPWPRLQDGSLDLARAPLRLLAIVNRLDLRDVGDGRAGEGRFVFGLLDKNGDPVPFTLILEYELPATSEADVVEWARAWHALGSLPFPSEEYNSALQAMTDRFTARRAGRNGGLAAVRTNEVSLDFPWELREFHLSSRDGRLHEAPVALTPDVRFVRGSRLLADFVNRHEREITRDRFAVPLDFEGEPLLGGAAPNDLVAWSAPGIQSPEARFHFSVNTCNGCHASPETHTEFLHVKPRQAGEAAELSAFLTGVAIHDPFSGELRVLNDLGRRKADLERIVCDRPDADTLRAGIRRVH